MREAYSGVIRTGELEKEVHAAPTGPQEGAQAPLAGGCWRPIAQAGAHEPGAESRGQRRSGAGGCLPQVWVRGETEWNEAGVGLLLERGSHLLFLRDDSRASSLCALGSQAHIR